MPFALRGIGLHEFPLRRKHLALRAYLWYNDLMKKLTKKQKGYADGVTKGLSQERSAIMAGASTDSVQAFEASRDVQQEIKRIRAEVIKNTGVTREEIVDMFMEAAGFARLMGDPMGMIAAARELGKMLGHYAPEVKKTLHGIDAAQLKKALKDMNDDELYKLAHAKVIDGEFTATTAVPGVQGNESPKVLLPEQPAVPVVPDPAS